MGSCFILFVCFLEELVQQTPLLESCLRVCVRTDLLLTLHTRFQHAKPRIETRRSPSPEPAAAATSP
jgi:hypothetical protein